jgi:hypothetical protein
MVRIVEHRSALPNGPILAVYVRHDGNAEPAVFAHIALEVFGRSALPHAFPERMPGWVFPAGKTAGEGCAGMTTCLARVKSSASVLRLHGLPIIVESCWAIRKGPQPRAMLTSTLTPCDALPKSLLGSYRRR